MKQISKKNIINIIECIVVCLGAGLLLDKGTRNILPPVIALGWAVVKFRNVDKKGEIREKTINEQMIRA